MDAFFSVSLFFQIQEQLCMVMNLSEFFEDERIFCFKILGQK